MKSRTFLSKLFSDYQQDLKRFVTNKFGDPHDAEDIVQDAFHNILRCESPEELENPKAYLFQTAQNLALNRIRKQRRHEGYVASQDHNAMTPPLENHVSAAKDLDSVSQAVHKLPEKCREAFIMSRVHGKTYGEIASALGVSVSTVEKYLIRALAFLRENLDEG